VIALGVILLLDTDHGNAERKASRPAVRSSAAQGSVAISFALPADRGVR